eukprot:2560597-Amphidinium_carterae.1
MAANIAMLADCQTVTGQRCWPQRCASLPDLHGESCKGTVTPVTSHDSCLHPSTVPQHKVLPATLPYWLHM